MRRYDTTMYCSDSIFKPYEPKLRLSDKHAIANSFKKSETQKMGRSSRLGRSILPYKETDGVGELIRLTLPCSITRRVPHRYGSKLRETWRYQYWPVSRNMSDSLQLRSQLDCQLRRLIATSKSWVSVPILPIKVIALIEDAGSEDIDPFPR